MTIAKDLQIINKGIKALSVKVEKLMAAVEKSEKPKVAKKAAARPVKEKIAKKVPAKNAATKKVAAKPTATDQVLKIINGSKDGVGVAALMEKTGFNQKKIYNIVQRTSKQGKIKSAGKGVYVGA